MNRLLKSFWHYNKKNKWKNKWQGWFGKTYCAQCKHFMNLIKPQNWQFKWSDSLRSLSTCNTCILTVCDKPHNYRSFTSCHKTKSLLLISSKSNVPWFGGLYVIWIIPWIISCSVFLYMTINKEENYLLHMHG